MFVFSLVTLSGATTYIQSVIDFKEVLRHFPGDGVKNHDASSSLSCRDCILKRFSGCKRI